MQAILTKYLPAERERHQQTANNNARLIAAAPCLLAALEAVVRADTYMHERGEALMAARAAIAKAKGKGEA